LDDASSSDLVATKLWIDTVDYVTNSVLADDANAGSLVIGLARKLLAVVFVSTFGEAVRVRIPDDPIDARPALLVLAIEFIDSNAINDIALADVAEAIHVTPRAVQYLFRRHTEMTPLQYLRGVRLNGARRDLLSGTRADDTVTAIAARWRFMHSGRFAVLYRNTFGESPHATLYG
jgi:transcriptional regulator GlxA family with amidase domain